MFISIFKYLLIRFFLKDIIYNEKKFNYIINFRFNIILFNI